MIFRKCPNCGSRKAIFKVDNIETPDMNEEELKKFEIDRLNKRLCYGPNDKKYYCDDCDFYFN